MAEIKTKVISYDLETEIFHGIQVSCLARATAEQLNLGEQECYEIALAGVLHDIGKLRLSGYVSGTENPLMVEELKYVRRHPQLGWEILKEKGYSPFVLESVYYHHENFDGSGYPENLRGEEIPLGGRILRVCDTFAALTEKRPYRDAFDTETAIAMMIDEVRHFDMKVFLAFLSAVHEKEE